MDQTQQKLSCSSKPRPTRGPGTDLVKNIYSSRANEIVNCNEEFNSYVFDLSQFLGGFSANISNHLTMSGDGKMVISENDAKFILGFSGGDYRLQIDRYSNEASDKPSIDIDPSVIDHKRIMGIDLISYDSSKGIPKEPEGIPSKERGFFKAPRVGRGGIIGIDINPMKRQDGVTPNVTLLHEMRHFVTYLGDYIMANDPKAGISYAIRDTNEYGRFRSKREMIEYDRPKLESFLGRSLMKDGRLMHEDYVNQLAYLNELHSSFVQGKLEWIDPKERIYIPGKEGTHHHVIGNDPTDKKNLDRLMHNLQKAYCLRYALSEKIATLNDNTRPNDFKLESFRESQVNALIAGTKEVMCIIGAIIGTSRSIRQANGLIERFWNEYATIMLDFAHDADYFHEKYFIRKDSL